MPADDKSCGVAGLAAILLLVVALSLAVLCRPGSAAAQEQPPLACPVFTSEPAPPEPERNDPATRRRVAEIGALMNKAPHHVLFLGNSITQRWPDPIWQHYFKALGSMNAGVDGDRSDHLLRHIEQWRLSSEAPAVIVLLIGTNDLGHGRTPVVAAEGIRSDLLYLRRRFPQTQILLLGLLPRWDRFGEDIAAVNQLLRKCNGGAVTYTEIGDRLLDQGRVSREISPDGARFQPSRI